MIVDAARYVRLEFQDLHELGTSDFRRRSQNRRDIFGRDFRGAEIKVGAGITAKIIDDPGVIDDPSESFGAFAERYASSEPVDRCHGCPFFGSCDLDAAQRTRDRAAVEAIGGSVKPHPAGVGTVLEIPVEILA